MANSEAEEGQRRLQRHALSEPVNIYDRISQAFVGQLVNVHAEGMMLMGNHPLHPERIYQLELRLPRPVKGRESIPVGVDCLWARSEESRVHWAGCRIIDIDDNGIEAIRELVANLGEG